MSSIVLNHTMPTVNFYGQQGLPVRQNKGYLFSKHVLGLDCVSDAGTSKTMSKLCSSHHCYLRMIEKITCSLFMDRAKTYPWLTERIALKSYRFLFNPSTSHDFTGIWHLFISELIDVVLLDIFKTHWAKHCTYETCEFILDWWKYNYQNPMKHMINAVIG